MTRPPAAMCHFKRLIASLVLCLTATAGFAQQPQADAERDCASLLADVDAESVEFSGAAPDTVAALAQHRAALIQHCEALRQHEKAVQQHRGTVRRLQEALRQHSEAFDQATEKLPRQRSGAAEARPTYIVRVTAADAGAQPTVDVLKWEVDGLEQQAFKRRKTPFHIEVNSDDFELVFQQRSGGDKFKVELLREEEEEEPSLTATGGWVTLQHDSGSGRIRSLTDGE